MLNEVLTCGARLAGRALKTVRLDKPLRRAQDLRLVFYHGIGDKQSPAMTYLNDEIPLQTFEFHIDYLQTRYQLVSLLDAIEMSLNGHLPEGKPIASISFDDGLASVYSGAFPVLKERDIPFDVFLNTGVVGNTDLLWLHALNYLLSSFGLEKTVAALRETLGEGGLPAFADAREFQYWCRNHFEFLHGKDFMAGLYARFGLCLDVKAEKRPN